MSDILSEDYKVDTQELADMPVYETSTTTKKGGKFLDNFFKYAERAVGLYKTAKSDKPVSQQPRYADVQLGGAVQEQKKVLGLPQVTGYIVIATIIGLLGYAVYSIKKKKES